ncbi:hypothetical protein [Mycolicibacterium houstonense]|uniref:hypothetical protein n=1 Tax=Mycolicibacterium houstonense TaxID=146021 RepID=UPI000A5D5E90|nr:hypothetical protein [Mycolicibacterium houstonense]
MSDSLARRQEALVRALVAGGPVPDGFDPAAVAAAGEVCRHKRDAHAGAAAPRRRLWLRLRSLLTK